MANFAASRRYFTPREFRWAEIEASKSTLSASLSSSSKSNKLFNIGVKMHILTDLLEGYANTDKMSIQALAPMGLMQSGDTKNRLMVLGSMLKHEKIADLKGNQRDLWDAFNPDGSFNKAEFGDNPNWSGEINNLEHNKEFIDFGLRVKRLNTIIHGNMDTEISPESKRYILGRLVGQYRTSWMAEGLANRFQPKIFDEILKKDIEGRYITTYKFMKSVGLAKGIGSLLKLMAFQGDKSFDGLKIKQKDKELIIANVRQTLNEMYYYLTIGAAYMAVTSMMQNDDRNKGAKIMTLNIINRTMGDISFYFQPGTFAQIINNPIPVLGIYTDGSRLISTITKHMEGESYYDDKIIARDIARNIPIINMWPKLDYMGSKVLQGNNGR
jgi:hypothetical protein